MKLLIPLAYLNEACFLSLNIDEKKFKMVLKLAQENLRDMLGSEFYEQIETQYDPSGGTLSTDNDALYEDYIKDFLAWRTYQNFLGFSQADSTPTGSREFKDDNSTILADVKLYSLEKNVANWVIHYRDKLINFLTLTQSKDSTKYPLYHGNCRHEFSWGFSCVSRNSTKDNIFSLNKAVTENE